MNLSPNVFVKLKEEGWLSILNRCKKQDGEFAGSWVTDGRPLTFLAKIGTLCATELSRGGHRRYYKVVNKDELSNIIIAIANKIKMDLRDRVEDFWKNHYDKSPISCKYENNCVRSNVVSPDDTVVAFAANGKISDSPISLLFVNKDLLDECLRELNKLATNDDCHLVWYDRVRNEMGLSLDGLEAEDDKK